jgi:hypothetical protein
MSQLLDAPRVATYLSRIEQFYADVKSWMAEIDPQAEISAGESVPLIEEGIGEYEAPTLMIRSSKSKWPVTIAPKGCNVLGASGYLEMTSMLGRERLVFIEPLKNLAEDEYSMRHLQKHPADGWAWMPIQSEIDLPHIDKDIFSEILRRFRI